MLVKESHRHFREFAVYSFFTFKPPKNLDQSSLLIARNQSIAMKVWGKKIFRFEAGGEIKMCFFTSLDSIIF